MNRNCKAGQLYYCKPGYYNFDTCQYVSNGEAWFGIYAGCKTTDYCCAGIFYDYQFEHVITLKADGNVEYSRHSSNNLVRVQLATEEQRKQYFDYLAKVDRYYEHGTIVYKPSINAMRAKLERVIAGALDNFTRDEYKVILDALNDNKL